MGPGEERKISYQLDRAIPDWKDTSNVSYRIVEIEVGEDPSPAAPGTDDPKEKLRKARQREAGNVVDLKQGS